MGRLIDAADNRREVHASSGSATSDAWYTYDADSHVLVTNGSLQNGQILVIRTTNSACKRL
jgi:hypothetical protein